MPHRHRPSSGTLTVRMEKSVIRRWRDLCRAHGWVLGHETQRLIERKIAEIEETERMMEKNEGGIPPSAHGVPGAS